MKQLLPSDALSSFEEKQIKKRILADFLDVFILIQIKRLGSLGGYDLLVALKRDFFVSLSAGTIYSQLYILERRGLILGTFDGDKTTFVLTPKGQAALAVFCDSSGELADFMKGIFSL
jgi:DNA-binding PadR family transcriptional regulator